MNALETGIYTQLAATATSLYALVGVKIYDQQAPPGTARPYVVFNLSGGGDWNETPVDRLELLYTVQGISDTDLEAGNIDDAIRARLHNQAISVAGYTAIGIKREGEIRYTEEVNGATVWHSGAAYRFYLSN